MKRIQIKWLKTYNVIISAILGVLGFTSCNIAEKYGCPFADYIILGKVTDSQTNEPIKDIQVEISWDKAFTNVDGEYKLYVQNPEKQAIPIKFQDIDGELNGSYMDLDTIVDFGKDWNEGKTTKEFNIKLNPKE